ncbi:MAG: hypothetical protein K0R43_566 [Pseudoduganella sp.]|jgi:hypothetical protein|nr:hypothetical protein [Pseudoduganella sp.]
MNFAPHPGTADCRTILADGALATISATRRPRANRAEVKCMVPGAPALGEAMQAVVRLARLTEPVFDSREQVVLSIDRAPGADERNWELAAVLADRMVRGIWQPAGSQVTAAGWSDNWQFGEVCGDAELAWRLLAQAGSAGETWLGAAGETAHGAVGQPWAACTLRHLGELSGHAHPRSGVASARAWFPLHSGGINDTLSWVEVSVRPLPAGGEHDEEATIAAPALDLALQQSVRQTLAGARHFDGKGLGRWKTAVRFAEPRLQGASWQLALVMADRLARGRECVPRGRVIATGSSGAWHAGRVEPVAGLQPKLELILQQAAPGDRVLLPRAWQDEVCAAYRAALRDKGASLACVESLGWI